MSESVSIVISALLITHGSGVFGSEGDGSVFCHDFSMNAIISWISLFRASIAKSISKYPIVPVVEFAFISGSSALTKVIFWMPIGEVLVIPNFQRIFPST